MTLADLRKRSGSLRGQAFRAAQTPLTNTAWWASVVILFYIGYAIIFAWTGGRTLHPALGSLRNLASVMVVALPCAWLIYTYLRNLSGPVALAAHVIAAGVFAYVWFFVLMVAIGLSAARSWSDFDVRPVFPTAASAWQLIQGTLVYAVLALAIELRTRSAAQPATGGSSPASRPFYFVRKDGEAFPIDLSQVILVRGADDYSEVLTLTGKHLVRLTLDRFQSQADPHLFCRIHRSLIVNVARIERFEPDGTGRMLVWLQNGEQVRTSRQGAGLLRARLI